MNRFTAWPPEALHRVAHMFISKMEGVSDEMRDACVEVCQLFHTSVVTLSDRQATTLDFTCELIFYSAKLP